MGSEGVCRWHRRKERTRRAGECEVGGRDGDPGWVPALAANGHAGPRTERQRLAAAASSDMRGTAEPSDRTGPVWDATDHVTTGGVFSGQGGRCAGVPGQDSTSPRGGGCGRSPHRLSSSSKSPQVMSYRSSREKKHSPTMSHSPTGGGNATGECVAGGVGGDERHPGRCTWSTDLGPGMIRGNDG
jgi:hypothetical protein